MTLPNVAPGMHICLLHTNRSDALSDVCAFLRQAIEAPGAGRFFGHDTSREELFGSLRACGCGAQHISATIEYSSALETYAPSGQFVPGDMLDRLRTTYSEIRRTTAGPVHVTGEMSWALDRQVATREALVEYEHAVNGILPDHPMSAICQYDTRHWEPEYLVDIMTAHPYLLVDGMLVASPHFRQASP